jgi:hypothetical protein
MEPTPSRLPPYPAFTLDRSTIVRRVIVRRVIRGRVPHYYEVSPAWTAHPPVQHRRESVLHPGQEEGQLDISTDTAGSSPNEPSSQYSEFPVQSRSSVCTWTHLYYYLFESFQDYDNWECHHFFQECHQYTYYNGESIAVITTQTQHFYGEN